MGTDDRLTVDIWMELEGFEPSASRLPAGRSSQLSYSPKWIFRRPSYRPALAVEGRSETQMHLTESRELVSDRTAGAELPAWGARHELGHVAEVAFAGAGGGGDGDAGLLEFGGHDAVGGGDVAEDQLGVAAQ